MLWLSEKELWRLVLLCKTSVLFGAVTKLSSESSQATSCQSIIAAAAAVAVKVAIWPVVASAACLASGIFGDTYRWLGDIFQHKVQVLHVVLDDFNNCVQIFVSDGFFSRFDIFGYFDLLNFNDCRFVSRDSRRTMAKPPSHHIPAVASSRAFALPTVGTNKVTQLVVVT